MEEEKEEVEEEEDGIPMTIIFLPLHGCDEEEELSLR